MPLLKQQVSNSQKCGKLEGFICCSKDPLLFSSHFPVPWAEDENEQSPGEHCRRAGNEIQAQLEWYKKDSCFWDSVAHSHTVRVPNACRGVGWCWSHKVGSILADAKSHTIHPWVLANQYLISALAWLRVYKWFQEQLSCGAKEIKQRRSLSPARREIPAGVNKCLWSIPPQKAGYT